MLIYAVTIKFGTDRSRSLIALMDVSGVAESHFLEGEIHGTRYLEGFAEKDYERAVRCFDSSLTYCHELVKMAEERDATEQVEGFRELEHRVELMRDEFAGISRYVEQVKELTSSTKGIGGRLSERCIAEEAQGMAMLVVTMEVAFFRYVEERNTQFLRDALDAYGEQKGAIASGTSEAFEELARAYEALIVATEESAAARVHLNVTAKAAAVQLKGMSRGAYKSYMKTAHDTSMTIYAIFFILLAVALTSSLYLSRIIVRDLNATVRDIETCATGRFDFSIAAARLKRRDEFADMAGSIQRMISSIREAIASIFSGAGEVATASQELRDLSQELSEGSKQQAAMIEEVSSSVEEMTANIDHNADKAISTKDTALRMEQKLVDINSYSNESLASVKAIGEKIAIITEIAAQTNILALNAAVESARAGEFGRGFSVVAAEIRKLAERSADAASEITELSQNSLESTELAAHRLNDVLPEVKLTAELVEGISGASQEQRHGVDYINQAVSELAAVVQRNAKAAQSMASNAHMLSSQADALNEATRFFHI